MQHHGTVPEDVPSNPGTIAGQHPEGRPIDEETETMRARLVYLSRKRGILEMEMLLSTFVQDRLKGMTREELQEYDQVGSFFSFFCHFDAKYHESWLTTNA